MRINPLKCIFNAGGGKLLGYLVTKQRLEANPEKIKAILDMSPPKIVKEVKRLAGQVATLNHSVSRSTSKCVEFFWILKNPCNF